MSVPARTVIRPIFPVLIFPVLLCVCPATAFATDGDAQLWLTTGLRAELASDLAFSADISARFSDDRGGVGTGIVRTTISHQLDESFSVEGAYGYFISYDSGTVTQREHRISQHLVWRMGQAAGGQWTARTRFEQRLVAGAADTGLRLRQRIGYRRPLSQKVNLTLSSEAFVALNDTDFGTQSGFDALRSTAAVSLPISDRINLDVGYLNQWTSRRNATDRLVHAGTATLTFRL